MLRRQNNTGFDLVCCSTMVYKNECIFNSFIVLNGNNFKQMLKYNKKSKSWFRLSSFCGINILRNMVHIWYTH